MVLAFQRRISTTSSFRAIFATAAVALLAPMRVEAQHDYEPSLIHMLPVYCKYTQDFRERLPGGNNRAEIERWTTLMGPMFNHMHHYCYGLMNGNRAAFLTNTREDRTFNLNKSINEFDYVIERAPPDFALLPEILTRKGESLIQLDRAGEAILEFQRAIKIKADYALAYAAVSDFYKRTGQLAKAREWLERGLSAAPNAKALTRRLAELDNLKDRRRTAPGPARKPAAPPPD
jgi:tetratricopeptide (TPR) repeat protein